ILAKFRYGEVDVDALCAGFETVGNSLGMWCRITVGNAEWQPVRQNSGRSRADQLPFQQRASIEHQFYEPVRTVTQRLQSETERVLDETVLHLQVLGTEERTFR